MSFLSQEQYLKIVEVLNTPYWNEGRDYRWEYMSYVIGLLREMPQAAKVIEAGSNGIPLHSDSFLFDLPAHDLDVTPYAVEDKAFDCFVALQVWEHLRRPREAFAEVMRISKNAVLSFPYKWAYGDKQHRGIDKDVIGRWTLGVAPQSIKIIKNRIVYSWGFGE
jgi:hypothetical protein